MTCRISEVQSSDLSQYLKLFAEACKKHGNTSETEDAFHLRYMDAGLAGAEQYAKGDPQRRKSISPELVKKLRMFILSDPKAGEKRVVKYMQSSSDEEVSPYFVHRILVEQDLETRAKRFAALKVWKDEGNPLTEEQEVLLKEFEQSQDEFEGHEASYPGALGAQDTFHLGNIGAIGDVYLASYLDGYSLYAVGRLFTSSSATNSITLLHDDVLPHYEQQGVQVDKILTDRGHEFSNKSEYSPYHLYAARRGIEHVQSRGRYADRNLISARFHRLVQKEFCSSIPGNGHNPSLQELQAMLDRWIEEYNSRAHPIDRLNGKSPWKAFQEDHHSNRTVLV